MFDFNTMQPFIVTDDKAKRDHELWVAITTAIHLCGLSGKDVTIMGLETLKRFGRYDMLPPCEKRDDI